MYQASAESVSESEKIPKRVLQKKPRIIPDFYFLLGYFYLALID